MQNPNAKLVEVHMQLPSVEVLALQLLPIYIQSWVFANKSLHMDEIANLTKLAKDSAQRALEEVKK